MRNQMEKAELEQRLTSSIDHVSHLNNQVRMDSRRQAYIFALQINFPRKDAQCDAKPKTVNKYVACKPNHRHRPTSMGPADVTTENGGASHMQDASTSYQDELTLARAQIHGLQRRLFDAMHTKVNFSIVGPPHHRILEPQEVGRLLRTSGIRPRGRRSLP